jgi:hypothetical protein
MSAFMEGRGPHGDGANHFEPTRTGPIESVACAGWRLTLEELYVNIILAYTLCFTI